MVPCVSDIEDTDRYVLKTRTIGYSFVKKNDLLFLKELVIYETITVQTIK